MPKYRITITDDTGRRLYHLSNNTINEQHLWFSWTKTSGEKGSIALGLPWSFDRNLLKRDNMIQVWRSPTGGRMSLFQVYFINRWVYAVQGSERSITVYGAGPNALLGWRRVAYFDKMAQAEAASVEADDLMKDLVSDNIVTVTAFEAGADTTARQWSTVSVQGDLVAGPQVTRSFSWQNVLESIQELSSISKEEGTHVWFDVFPVLGNDSISFMFRTYTGQPGRDLTDLGVLFSEKKGTMINPSLEYDHSEEITYVYGLGQGEASARNVQTASDTTRINQSAYGRKEGAVSAIFQQEDDGVTSEAERALFEGRPRVRFTAQPVDTAQFRFGRDWDWGDKMTAQFENIEFDCIVSSVQISVRDGQESLNARLEYES